MIKAFRANTAVKIIESGR